eukprot:CAMPEP_0204020074 /NCGR_PEP_ID=MMETSP0360-20130528/29181_1 /ASSEMBLY_ACC=CAM_ASM_000342 /TAXON_ID=268821 /ORGANISM="Scrippsiella Hangoei, Strain SHTV-5" /LENGTH=120 /DNA_ID=CAMNT_0050963349 /DNA_START=244 /DNA_END=604 /DNA_ORIENTATION=-
MTTIPEKGVGRPTTRAERLPLEGLVLETASAMVMLAGSASDATSRVAPSLDPPKARQATLLLWVRPTCRRTVRKCAHNITAGCPGCKVAAPSAVKPAVHMQVLRSCLYRIRIGATRAHAC